jgi:hypothetical protein
MALTKALALQMATVAAAGTERLPKLMDQHCMDITRAVIAALPAQVPAVTAGYIAMRWQTPQGGARSHVAALLFEGGSYFVVDASWQQYPYVDKMTKYMTSNRDKHTRLSMTEKRDRASDKAVNNATRVMVATPDTWQRAIEAYNAVDHNTLVRRIFMDQQAASDWMGFRV